MQRDTEAATRLRREFELVLDCWSEATSHEVATCTTSIAFSLLRKREIPYRRATLQLSKVHSFVF